MKILISGGSGFIGRALCDALDRHGHQIAVLSRTPHLARRHLKPSVDVQSSLDALADFSPAVIINLAGAGIADRRWSDKRKRLLLASRIQTTQNLVAYAATQKEPIEAFLSASAVGYYGDCGDGVVDESHPAGKGFAHELCAQWETEALRAQTHVSRVCLLRIGLVLDQPGGLLDRMVPPFKLGLGGRMGDGEQYMPWIHRLDVVRIFEFLLGHSELSGPINVSAPHPVTNQAFTDALARALHRPAKLPAPECVLRLAFGEMADLLVQGANMVPSRLLSAGYEFEYPQLDEALSAILR